METSATVQCPYCFEAVSLYVDPGTEGDYVEDCEVCCQPWQVHVERDADGGLRVTIERAQ
jgi:hypothetical protein